MESKEQEHVPSSAEMEITGVEKEANDRNIERTLLSGTNGKSIGTADNDGEGVIHNTTRTSGTY